LWQEKQATVEGKHYAVRAAYCEPKPDPLPPIMIGGNKPRILRLIARHADWWDVSGFGVGLDRYRTCVEEMGRACAEVGRDPATLRHTYSAGCVCAPTEDEAAALAKDLFRPGMGFIGTPAQVRAKLQPFIDLGVDHFQLMPAGSDDLQTLKLLVQEVLPAL
jgi:alkanesulfonate monooxygenase SsuD/methylene tetrahydromethanopterin reductase-like flavin-dependent oxidoreductase (luciferase family)